MPNNQRIAELEKRYSEARERAADSDQRVQDAKGNLMQAKHAQADSLTKLVLTQLGWTHGEINFSTAKVRKLNECVRGMIKW